MEKTAVVVHGWPRPVTLVRKLESFLWGKGYNVVVPRYLEDQEGFSLDRTLEIIKKELGGKPPDLILGLSLGGIIAPYLAILWPKAKLILVATGLRFDPKGKWMLKGVKVVAGKYGLKVLKMAKSAPWGMFCLAYWLINIGKGDVLGGREVKQDMKDIFRAFQELKVKQARELINWVLGVDNSEIVKQIKNKCLILSGIKDKLMPDVLGREIAEQMKNSRLGLINGAHRNVLSAEGYKMAEVFLSS